MMKQAEAERATLHEGSCAPRLERRADGQLWAGHDGAFRQVRVTRCFPWSAPAHFISLRDEQRNEVVLIADPAMLDARSRALLEEALVEADFVFVIEAIESIAEETEIRCWSVITHQGPRRFQTRRDEWPRPVPGSGLLIRDVAGDLFHIAAPSQLDARSRKLLWAYVD
jgi:hypothetical protein